MNNRPTHWLSAMACLICPAAAAQSAQIPPPVVIGHHLQLFVDCRMVDRSDHVALRLHSPHPAEVALKFDRPWEGASNHYPVVFKDGSLYRMYYHSAPNSADHKNRNPFLSYVGYAESPDGITWNRPDLGLFDFQGSKHNNIVWPFYGSDIGALLVPVVNGKPGAPPEMHYLAAGVSHRSNTLNDARLYVFASADAIHWRRLSERPIAQHSTTHYPPPNFLDSSQILFWDEPGQKYFLYMRDEWVAPETGERMRGLRFSTSSDLTHWTYPEWIHLDPNPPDQFYTALPLPYFREPTVYFCFPMRYMAHRDAEMPAQYDANRGTGVTDLVFMSSRDGLHWDRTFLESYLRPGMDPLKWTDRSNSAGPGPIPTRKDEMSLYVVEYFHLPFSQIRRFSQRLDGMVSMHAGYENGCFVTKPLIFAGHRLSINASTSAAGGIRVEVLGLDGKPIDRYSGENALEFFGDALSHDVRWDQGPDIGALAGVPVRLRFLMKDADLFSYHFID